MFFNHLYHILCELWISSAHLLIALLNFMVRFFSSLWNQSFVTCIALAKLFNLSFPTFSKVTWYDVYQNYFKSLVLGSIQYKSPADTSCLLQVVCLQTVCPEIKVWFIMFIHFHGANIHTITVIKQPTWSHWSEN